MTTTIDGAVALTSAGRYVYPLRPDWWTPDIHEIAEHLSGINRYLGATIHPSGIKYSVAEHSVRVADLLPEGLQLDGLLHDSPEAYLGDVPSYLKHDPEHGAAHRKAEARLAARFEKVFGCDFDHDLIHQADRVLMATERRDLLPEDDAEWLILRGVKPLPERIIPWSSQKARSEFLVRYARLTAMGAAA